MVLARLSKPQIPSPYPVPDVAFAIPGDLQSPTGGYAYDRRVLGLLASYGINATHVELPGSYPAPSAHDLDDTERLIAAAPPHAKLLIDGLAYGAMPAELIDRLGRRIIALVHHPLALEAGLSDSQKSALVDSEKAALARARHVIVTSRSTADSLTADYGVPKARITVAEPGTNPALRATGTGTPMQLLAVGAVSARKAYDVLVAALEPLADLDWRLTIAGATDRNAETVTALRERIAASPISERITLAGAVVPATLDRFYASADLFVSPSLYEGYGMVLAEAMARGLPIVCTTGGAAAETVPDAAALKAAPGNVEELTAALRQALTHRKQRRAMADAAWDAGRQLPTWEETARRIAAAILEIKA